MIGYERYATAGAEPEWMLNLGPHAGSQLLFIPPIFEEANFTRSFIVAVARWLTGRGIGVWIPDLPGCGESHRRLATVSLGDWRRAVAAAADHVLARTHVRARVASFRAGAILDDAAQAPRVWRFAPATGAEQLRAMRRAQAIADREAGSSGAQLVGYQPSADLVSELEAAVPNPTIEARTISWPAGSAPFWRRAEPANDKDLAARVGHDLHVWIEQCGA